MRICYLANAESIHTYRWVNYFAEKGHQIYLISLKPPKFDYGKVEIFLIKKIKTSPTFGSHLINFFPLIFQLWWLKTRIRANLFHALGSSNGWLAALVGFRPLIFTIADPGIFSIPFLRGLPKIYKILNKFAIKNSNLLVCDGENTKKAMIDLGASPQKIRIIRYGVDIEKFKPEKINENFKERIFRKEAKIVISTKPLRKENDVETLIRAIPLIIKEIPETRFLILGEGEEKENLVKLAKFLNVSNVVRFFGWVSPQDLPKYLNIADFFVCTSLVETGIAASTAEAMACGLPVVVSDSGDNRIWIKNGENGFIFSLKNPSDLARKIIWVLKNKSFKEKVGKINREIIKEHNNYQKEMAKMENIYQELLNERKN